MRRREFVAALGATAASAAATRAQPALLVVGVLSARSPPPEMAAFRQGLADGGYVEGRNLKIESRWAEGRFDRLPALAADLAQHRAAVIVATGVTSALAAKAATPTIPLVFLAADDPVKFGLVASLSRPGGNATGLNLLTSELNTKRLELARELLPGAATVLVLVNPRSPESEPQLRDLQTAANAIGQQLRVLNASNDPEIETAFAAIASHQNAALLVTNDPLFTSRRDQFVALAARHAVPTIYDRRSYAAGGGLISYGPDYLDGYRKLGIYAAKVLSGTNPADLPVEQSTKLELVINAKTAKVLGLQIPPRLLALADEVIE
jgi:putative tryptophan/tyrosine transport system substrate-binding protein